MTKDLAETALSGAGLVAKPTFDALRRQFLRRNAEAGVPGGTVDVSFELDEALDVLAGGSENLISRLVASGKAWASDRPSAFANEPVRRWVGDPQVRAAVKAAVTLSVQGLGHKEQRRLAVDAFERVTGERSGPAERYFEDAVAFLVLTLGSYLPADARTIIAQANANRSALGGQIEDVKQVVEARASEIKDLIGSLGVPVADDSPAPTEVVDTFVTRALDKAAKRRWFAEASPVEEFLALAVPLQSGTLRSASPGVRQRAYRETAAATARAGRLDEAQLWLGEARAVPHANDLIADEARLLLAQGDQDAAMRSLRERSDPTSNGLLLDAVRHRSCTRAAVDLFGERFGSAACLTGDGLHAFVGMMLELGEHDAAHDLLREASPEQLSEAPALLFVRSRVAAALCLAPEIRGEFVDRLGLFPLRSALRDDPEGQALLAQAVEDIRAFRREIAGLDLPGVTSRTHEIETWFGLVSHDEATRTSTHERLSASMQTPDGALDHVALASSFGVPFDAGALRRQLDDAERLGGWSDRQTAAAFFLLLQEGDPKALAEFLERHRAALESTIPSETLDALTVEALAKSGDTAAARRLYEGMQGTPGARWTSHLGTVVAEAEGGDPVRLRIAAFEASGDTRDLDHLVGLLRHQADHRRLARYLPLLWDRLRRLGDARAACDALLLAGDEDGLGAFLDRVGEAGDDPALKLHAAFAASRAGDFRKAARLATQLVEAGHRDANLRSLRINVAMETGRWDDLHAILGADLAASEERSAEELVQASQLAHAVGARDARALIEAAVAKVPDDPGVLMAAYMALVQRGEEATDPRAATWLQRAVDRSGPDGPVQVKQFKEAIAIMKAQRESARDVSMMALRGDIPLALALTPLNVSLSEMFCGVLPGNVGQDPRRRVAVPLFAGNRGPVDMTGVGCIGLDPNAILLQAELGILELILRAFDKVVIPAGFLSSLVRDLGRVRVHQPSRVEEARRLVDAVEARSVRPLEPGTFDRTLAREAGEEFAQLLAAAERVGGLAVVAPPLHRVDANMEETVDVTPFEARLVAPHTIVDVLAASGSLDAYEEAEARSSLPTPRSDWSGGGCPTPGVTPLFIDELALHYLDQANLLPPLAAAFPSLFIHPGALARARAELAAAPRAERIVRTVERLRAVLEREIATEKVRIGPRRHDQADESGVKQQLREEIGPTTSLIVDPGPAELLVFDDRLVNSHLQSTDRRGQAVPVATTLDVIDSLAAREVIDPARRLALRHALRLRGVVLVPLEREELAEAALRGDPRRFMGEALRAVRDNLALTLIAGAVRLPMDAYWYRQALVAVLQAIQAVWVEATDAQVAEAAANNLLGLLPRPEEWVGLHEGEDREMWVREMELMVFGFLSGESPTRDADRAVAYRDWAERAVVEPALLRGKEAFERTAAIKKTLLAERLLPLLRGEGSAVAGNETPSPAPSRERHEP